MTDRKVDISVIITAHAEGILAHKTIMSVQRAIEALEGKYTSEIILHLDNPSDATINYVTSNKKGFLKDIRSFTNHFGDAGLSRNFAVKKALGRYVAIIDADDLMSGNWLKNALDALGKQPKNSAVAHSEFTIEFGDIDVVVEKYRSTSPSQDALLSVWSNRWNVVIVAPRSLLLENPYPANSPGFGYEDWWLNNTLLYLGIKQILIPETAIFVRRRNSTGQWLRHTSSMSVLRKNALLSPSYIRSLKPAFMDALNQHAPSIKNRIKHTVKVRLPLSYEYLAKSLGKLRQKQLNQKIDKIPRWLANEWRDIHSLDATITAPSHGPRSIRWHPAISTEHQQAGALYKAIVDKLKYNHYDYLLFVPWLMVGGADKYVIELVNRIQKTKKSKRLLVIATLPNNNAYASYLDDKIDFIDFGNLACTAHEAVKNRVIEHLIENSGVTHIHIVNSKFGYDFVESHRSYIKTSNKTVIATSFGRTFGSDGQYIGYTDKFVPRVYDLLTLATSDNQATLKAWQQEYGFDAKKLYLMRQPIDFNKSLPAKHETPGDKTRLKVLWAARIAPEKLPELVPEIAGLVSNFADIDMYGYHDRQYNRLLSKLPANVRYRGDFQDGLASLPTSDYDVYLYTSNADGTPNAPLEAIQVGLPVVASAVGGVPDFIINNKSGLLISNPTDVESYAEALEKLRDSKLRANLANAATAIVKRDFSRDSYNKSVAEYLKIIGY